MRRVAAAGATAARSIPVSAIVVTCNEAPNIAACLAALGAFAEVVVVDSESSDGTPERAAALGARVVRYRWDGRYPKKRQWCLETLALAHDWVFFVDADEQVTPALEAEMAALFAAGPPRHAGYFIDGRPVFLGRPLRFGHRNRKLCLFDRRRTQFPVFPDLDIPAMGEIEGHYQPVVAGPVGRLRAALLHADAKGLSAWFERHNRYSDWEAAILSEPRWRHRLAGEPLGRRLLKRLFLHLPLKPLAVFARDYIICLGLLDGHRGFHAAVARAFYYWQVAVKKRERQTQAATPPQAGR